ncbi:hypothetical protein DP113_28120 [Brasilonema octagenarum UFV-E1]|uniref:VWFD domain-containing protein n=2 Tax=Brasilonema TaxID=383614 RepID=A0A856MQF0_9CYAN|nr:MULTISPECIES: VWD domain-containing protein [Brasilonema]NMF65124.1 hypothetical protein [Brasilonema octagenarum UFV-OR1]QDL11256.1 hypothetical protein DP114_28190 [Brasilonema sennae CENA114]QDL17601.1 hypothetical protein DP113_28120 [Brasilonema octagenarum UFV-E1]
MPRIRFVIFAIISFIVALVASFFTPSTLLSARVVATTPSAIQIEAGYDDTHKALDFLSQKLSKPSILDSTLSVSNSTYLTQNPNESNFDPCKSESYKRLLQLSRPNGLPREVQTALTGAKAELQPIADGSGEYIYDEYKITFNRMPQGVTPESFLGEMLRDLNGTVSNPRFDEINEFKRRRSEAPKLGDIIDIDIYGPDNGSVVLSDRSDSNFVFSTIKTPKTGSHPEYGSREFGFERNPDESVTFYTRGASRPQDRLSRKVGDPLQEDSWTSLMSGISTAIYKRGGKTRRESFRKFIKTQQNPPNCDKTPNQSNRPNGQLKQGKSYGDPHLITFDGLSYSFQTVGEFIVVKSNDGKFEVQVRHAPVNSSLSLNSAVAMKVGSDRVAFYSKEFPDSNTSTPLRINGKPTVIQGDSLSLPGGNTIAKSGDTYVVNFSTGEKVVVDTAQVGGNFYFNVSPFVLDSQPERYSGLLGNVNGNPKDDQKIRGGGVLSSKSTYGDVKQVLNLVGVGQLPVSLNAAEKLYFDQLYKDFANSWRISQKESLFDYLPNKTTENYTDRKFPDKYLKLEMLSSEQVKKARSACEAAKVTQDMMEGCIFDVGFTGFSEFARATAEINSYVETLNTLFPGLNIPTSQRVIDNTIERVKPKVCAPIVGCL